MCIFGHTFFKTRHFFIFVNVGSAQTPRILNAVFIYLFNDNLATDDSLTGAILSHQ